MRPTLDTMLAVRPAAVAVRSAGEALGLGARELLHAGPPFAHPRHPPAPIVSSVVMTCLHEGWARDEAQAQDLLASGAVTLSPAQPRGCLTPLAAIVSPGTPLFEIRDAGGIGGAIHAPVSVVRGADTRMGSRDPALLARLQVRDRETAPGWAALLRQRGPIDLWAPAVHGLRHGDDLHSRTTAANEALAVVVRERGNAALADAVAATPLFFLTLWMAAASCILRAGEGGDLPTLVTRAGGNGERFGIALAGAPTQWITHDAPPPQGPFIASAPSDAVVQGALGDSAVIDLLGLGGQRVARSPEPWSLVQSQLPPDHDDRSRQLLLARHPGLPDAWPIGIEAQRVLEQAHAPFVMLAMIAADGRSGFLGRGGCALPLALFEQALS